MSTFLYVSFFLPNHIMHGEFYSCSRESFPYSYSRESSVLLSFIIGSFSLSALNRKVLILRNKLVGKTQDGLSSC